MKAGSGQRRATERHELIAGKLARSVLGGLGGGNAPRLLAHIVAKEVFGWVDHQIFRTLWAWIRRRHSVRGARWCKDRYFQQIETRKWVFTLPNRKGPKLILASDTPIRRHVKIRMEAHPFNPVWTEYLERRMSRARFKNDIGFLPSFFQMPQRSFS